MEHKVFNTMQGFEKSWWYKSRLRVVRRATTVLPPAMLRGAVIDMGAGFGGMRPLFEGYERIDGYEPNQKASEALESRGYAHVYRDLDFLKSRVGDYDTVCAFDVLEHIKNDHHALREWHALLKEDGTLLLTVPALPVFWSQHDVDCHHFRRYKKDALLHLLSASGFEVHYATYWNCVLALPAFLARKSRMVDAHAETTGLSPLLDTIFDWILRLETLSIPYLSLPFGTGLVIVATKKELPPPISHTA